MNIFEKLLEYISSDLAIDLGTANTLVYSKGRGIVSNEPSVVAVQDIPGQKPKLIAVGHQAREMVGRTPQAIRAVRPLRDGVIADFDAAQKMIEYFINKSKDKTCLLRPRIIVSIPLEITEVEKRAVRESAEAAGARRVYLIEETMCAAIGAGIEVSKPSGSMVVDIGGGTTGIAVISLSGIVVSKSIKVGGDKMDEAIQQWVKKNYDLIIGYTTAETLKKKFSLQPEIEGARSPQMTVTGRNTVSGVPSNISINIEEIEKALEGPVNQIVEAILQTLEITPPELSADVFNSGIMLAGGGSLLRGIRTRIEAKTGIKIRRAEQPLDCVVLGSGKALEDIDLLNSVSV